MKIKEFEYSASRRRLRCGRCTVGSMAWGRRVVVASMAWSRHRFMDNTAKRTLSPLLLLGEAFEGMLEMTHVGPFEERPIGVGNDDLGKLYGTAHYLFGCIGYKLANEGVGEWDDSYFENITIPVGWHHAHMLSLLLAVIALLAKLKERSKWEEVHWLSLWFGMAFRVVLYGPEHMLPAQGLLEAHKIRVDVFTDAAGNRIWARTSAPSHF